MDLDYWAHGGESNEWELLAGCIADLAAAREADLDKCISGYMRVRPLAAEYKRHGDRTVVEYWGKALRDRQALQHYSDFSKIALPAMAQFLGNGELEGDFSRIKAVGFMARSCDRELTRAWVKLLIDGPRPDCIPKAWHESVQRAYVAMFGRKDMATSEASAASAVVKLDARRGVKRPHACRGKAAMERERRQQLTGLKADGAAARNSIFGEAPSAAAATAFAAEPAKLLEASASYESVKKLSVMARRHREKLVADRLPASNPVLQSLVAKYQAKEENISAARGMATISNPKLDLAEGRFYVPTRMHCGRLRALVYAPAWHSSHEDRMFMRSIGHEGTKDIDTALNASKHAELAYVDDTTAFLKSPRTQHAWSLRVLGAGVVDASWLAVVRTHRRLPPPVLAFHGLRTPRVVALEASFATENPHAAVLLHKAMERLPASACAWRPRTIADAVPKSTVVVRLVGTAEKREYDATIAKQLAATKAATASKFSKCMKLAKAKKAAAAPKAGAKEAAAAPNICAKPAPYTAASSSSSASPAPRPGGAASSSLPAAALGSAECAMARVRCMVWSADDLWLELSRERNAATTLDPRA